MIFLVPQLTPPELLRFVDSLRFSFLVNPEPLLHKVALGALPTPPKRILLLLPLPHLSLSKATLALLPKIQCHVKQNLQEEKHSSVDPQTPHRVGSAVGVAKHQGLRCPVTWGQRP